MRYTGQPLHVFWSYTARNLAYMGVFWSYTARDLAYSASQELRDACECLGPLGWPQPAGAAVVCECV